METLMRYAIPAFRGLLRYSALFSRILPLIFEPLKDEPPCVHATDYPY